jgi:hypothetical protein
MTDRKNILNEMNNRSREVFRRVVEGYLDTGDPVGSRTLTRELSEKVSAATIRTRGSSAPIGLLVRSAPVALSVVSPLDRICAMQLPQPFNGRRAAR